MYLLPIRREKFSRFEAQDFADYFKKLARAGCEVLVIDGSPPEVFSEHAKVWADVCRHKPVDPRFKNLNDKVNGVHTGVALASNEKIILADDDVRYDKIDIERMCALLDQFEVVRPQNYLRDAVRVWALAEAARMLINRATLRTADYPGTCGFRRQTFLNAGEYDGDVLFDNEELIRHFARRRARIAYENDFFIFKRTPSFRKWLEQRPRQAYEDFGLRSKTILFASVLPISIAICVFRGVLGFAVFFLLIWAGSAAIAVIGRRRGTASQYFNWQSCPLACLWVFERAISTWLAFYWRIRYRGYPFGRRLLKKGIGRDWIEGGKIAAATHVSRN